jgi:ankyrin repeat protein
MTNDTFFVPEIEGQKTFLYQVRVDTTGDTIDINGTPSAFVTDIENCFKNFGMEDLPKVSVSLINNTNGDPLKDITENERSVFLGLFLQIYREHLHLDYKDEWASITVSGDLVPHDGRIDLKAVAAIDRKYLGVAEYAKENPGDHLFLYIGDEDIEALPECENVQIKSFTPGDSLYALRYFLFGPLPLDIKEEYLDPAQKRLVGELSAFRYIRAKAFYAAEEEIHANRDLRGYFIYGEGNTGKSAMARALSSYLINCKMIYAPLWIRISGTLYDRKTPENSGGEDYLSDYNNREEEYIVAKICGTLDIHRDTSLLTKSLQYRRYAIIIDGLEFPVDKIYRLLNGLKNVLAAYFRLKPYIIITSKLACREDLLREDFGIVLTKAPELNTGDIDAFIGSLTRGPEYKEKMEQARESVEYGQLLEELYNNYRWYPGIIITITSLLRYEKVDSLIRIVRQFGGTEDDIQKKQENMYAKAFGYLDGDARRTLYVLMRFKLTGSRCGKEEILSFVQEHYKVSESEETIKGLNKALRALQDSNFIYLEQDSSGYGIKTLPFLIFMFNPNFAGQADTSGASERDAVLTPPWQLYAVLEYDQSCGMLRRLIEKYGKEALTLNNNAFIHAVKKSSDPDKLELLKQQGCDINYKDKEGMTALINAAIVNPSVDVMEWLLSSGANKKIRCGGNNAFHWAAAFNANPQVLECMIRHGFKTSDKAADGAIPFAIAARWNSSTEILDFFASRDGFDIDVKVKAKSDIKKAIKEMETYTDEDEEEEETGTYVLSVLKVVAKLGPDSKDTTDIPAIYSSILNPNAGIFQWFINHGASLEACSDGATPLYAIAKYQSNPVFLDILKETGYDIMEKIEGGLTAFHGAALSNGSIPVFEWLKENGLDINAKDDDGETPFFFALHTNHHPEILEWFIENGGWVGNDKANINDCFELALTENESTRVFHWFLDQGANINAADSEGNTILHDVAQSDCPAANIIWMLTHGADPDVLDGEGRSAMDYLSQRSDWHKIQRGLKRP